MATFTYRAMNATGRVLRGSIAAANEADLFYRLQQAGLDLIEAAPRRESRFAALLAKPIRTRDLVELCIHLEQLERVGVPILDALEDIREATDSVRLRDVLADVIREIGNGRLLSDALATHPRVFNQVFTGLIAAGEQTGSLGASFRHLVKHLKWTEEMQSKVKRALRYPAFVLVLSIGMIVTLLTVLVPQLTGFLKANGMVLPFETRALIATSAFVQDYWLLLLIVPAGLVAFTRLAYIANPNVAYSIDYYVYRIPLFGTTMRKIALSRFSHFFAIMFQSGIGMLVCIDTASRVVANRALSTSIGLVRDMVEGGSTLTNALRSSGEFPSLVVRMVKIGEETGNLKETLDSVAYFYDRDVEDSVTTLVASLQPALTMVVGAIMLWIIVAMFGPLYDSFSHLNV